MELAVVGKKSKVAASDAVFACDYNEALIHQVVTAYQAAGRQGTKQQKNRSDVRGGGRKPWKQKGTGNARAGSIRSPLWVGGGRTFAARPRNFAQKINRKMYVRSMTSILSQLVRENRVHVVTEIKIAEAKTKQLLEQLNNWKIDSKAVLILTHEMDASVMLAARNVHWVKYDLAQNVNPVDLICAETVIVSEGSLKVLEERLA